MDHLGQQNQKLDGINTHNAVSAVWFYKTYVYI